MSIPPAITVVIPTHNRAVMLDHAIQSVLASPLIERPGQIIVVDDMSEDDPEAVARRHGTRFLRVEAHGPSGSRNAGLAAVDTEFVAFLDDDDAWLPGNMAPQIEALRARPSLAFAFGRTQRTEPDLTPFGAPVPEGEPVPGRELEFIYERAVQLGCVLFRTDHARRAGGFDERIRYGEDQHLMLRLAARHGAASIDAVGSLFRQRIPERSAARERWQAHRNGLLMRRLLRAEGIRPGWKAGLATERRSRGLQAHLFCLDASLAASQHDLGEGFFALSRALLLSPVHSVANPRLFFGSAVRLLGQSARRRSAYRSKTAS